MSDQTEFLLAMAAEKEHEAERTEVAKLQAENSRLSTLVGEMVEGLGPDLAGRAFADLLDDTALYLENLGGGPTVECLRAKAEQVRSLLQKAKESR